MPTLRNTSKKRLRILQTAEYLFERHGYRLIGIDRILLESGISKATLYRHFGSKTELILATLTQRAEQFDLALRRSVDDAQTPAERIRSVFEFYDNWMSSDGFFGCMFIQAAVEFCSEEPMVMDTVRKQKVELTGFIRNCLTPDGGDEASYQALAEFIVMVLDGAIVHAEEIGDRNAAKKAWPMVSTYLDAMIPVCVTGIEKATRAELVA